MARFILLVLLLFPAVLNAHPLNHPVQVIATFSILGDFAKMIGGDEVDVYSLVRPDVSPHDYKPTHTDQRFVEHSDLVVANGMGLEGWLGPMLQKSKEPVNVVNASKDIKPRYGAGGGIDPHGWLSVANAMIYVKTIRDALVLVDPLHATTYKSNAETYLVQLNKLDHWIELQMGRLSAKQRGFVTNHDNFAYFGQEYGFRVLSLQGLQPDDMTVAGDDPHVLKTMKDQNIRVLFSENVASPRSLMGLQALSGGVMGGKLYSDALSADAGAQTYLEMMRTNTQRIYDALKGSSIKK